MMRTAIAVVLKNYIDNAAADSYYHLFVYTRTYARDKDGYNLYQHAPYAWNHTILPAYYDPNPFHRQRLECPHYTMDATN
jgi:hypothetical protein